MESPPCGVRQYVFLPLLSSVVVSAPTVPPRRGRTRSRVRDDRVFGRSTPGFDVEVPAGVPADFPISEGVKVVVTPRLIHAEEDVPRHRLPVLDDAPQRSPKPPRSPGRETPFVDLAVG